MLEGGKAIRNKGGGVTVVFYSSILYIGAFLRAFAIARHIFSLSIGPLLLLEFFFLLEAVSEQICRIKSSTNCRKTKELKVPREGREWRLSRRFLPPLFPLIFFPHLLCYSSIFLGRILIIAIFCHFFRKRQGDAVTIKYFKQNKIKGGLFIFMPPNVFAIRVRYLVGGIEGVGIRQRLVRNTTCDLLNLY